MSCYACLTKFSFFTKELSCSNCRYSFCSKCLKQKAIVGEEEKSVCKNCFKKLTSDSNSMSTPDMDTPGLLLKRLETLENPAKPPITIFRHSARLANLKYGLSSEDKQILERLEKLKADHNKVSVLPDENEIKRRLALLQDRSIESMSSKSEKFIAPQKSAQEEIDDLLKKYIDETGIEVDFEESGNKKTEEIEERLKKLQMSETAATVMNVDPSHDDLANEDSETLKIIKKAIAEGQLERKLKDSSGQDEESEISDMDDNEPESELDSESDLPWCIICNENAVVKCFGCDGSLYCDSCFKQGHEYFDMDDHKFVPFTKNESPS